jgi:RHS repeat-associated protein
MQTVGPLVALLIGALAAPTVAAAQSAPPTTESSQMTAAAPTVEYYHVDAVGSVRAVTDKDGNVVRRHDYFPFGDGPVEVAPGTDPVRFTGKERDVETGLDYFGARYYASRSGRFTTVDPALDIEQALVDPQLWNRYTYVRNNPFRFVDPDGRDTVPTQWQMTHGADGLARVLPAIGKAIFNTLVALNSPGHLSPEGEARRQSQFMQPANTEQAVIMGLTDVAMVAGALMPRAGKASAIERGTLTSTADLEATHAMTMSRSKFADLKADIAKNGIREPIKYIEVNGQKFVVDGHHRLRAAQALGIRNVPAQRVNLPYGGYGTREDLVNTDR